MKRTSSLLVAVLAAFALPVLAQTAPAAAKNPAATPGVDQRQVNQQQRIDQGVQSGQLTGKEAAKLDKGQAQADGKVTPKEREKLKQAQNKQSAKIKHQKHDKQHDLNHDGKKDAPAAKK